MLYATTRNSTDAYTAQRVLQDRRASDGGFYVPFRLPVLKEEEIASLKEKSFHKNVAEILNLLFNTHLTSFDLDLGVGRYSVRLEMLNTRLIMAECWHNPQWEFRCYVKDLLRLVRQEESSDFESGDWSEIGIRIAVIFGIFGELMRHGIADTDKKVDISVVAGDFSAPMSAWYARAMGLPVGNIICSCNENGNLWNFICHGQLRTDGIAVPTCIPEADIAIPTGIERLIYACGGHEEVQRYLEAARLGKTYYADDKLLQKLRQGIYVTVTSQHRVLETIPNAYTTHDYILSPSAALNYIGLQDYRARTGECRNALIFTEKSPRTDVSVVARALGFTQQTLEKML